MTMGQWQRRRRPENNAKTYFRAISMPFGIFSTEKCTQYKKRERHENMAVDKDEVTILGFYCCLGFIYLCSFSA